MADQFLPLGAPTHPTPFLQDNSYNRNPIHVNLTIEDSFEFSSKFPTMGTPYRITYVEDKDIYVLFWRNAPLGAQQVINPKDRQRPAENLSPHLWTQEYTGRTGRRLTFTPSWSGTNAGGVTIGKHAPTVSVVKGDTKEILVTYYFNMSLCPAYSIGDECVDFCVHYTKIHLLEFSFFVVNPYQRNAWVIRFRERWEDILSGGEKEDIPEIELELLNSIFYADIIPRGTEDHEIATTYTTRSVTHPTSGQRYIYPVPNLAEILTTLRSRYYIGKINPKYCNMTCLANDRYFFTLGHRMENIYCTPFLPYPVDIQHLYSLDTTHMYISRNYIGPLYDTMVFNETTLGQPFLTAMTHFDGRHLLFLTERKYRHLHVRFTYLDGRVPGSSLAMLPVPASVGAITENTYIGGIHYPVRPAGWSYVNDPMTRYMGHTSAWNPTILMEPERRETTWRTINSCLPLMNRDVTFADFETQWKNVLLNLTLSESPDRLLETDIVDDDGNQNIISVPTQFSDAFCYVMGKNALRVRVERMVFLDLPLAEGGIPQDAIYATSLYPGVIITQTYWVRNMSTHTSLRNIVGYFPIDKLPLGVSVEIQDFPTMLGTEEELPIKIVIRYYPPTDSPIVEFLCIPFILKYYAVYSLNCNDAVTFCEPPAPLVDVIPPPPPPVEPPPPVVLPPYPAEDPTPPMAPLAAPSSAMAINIGDPASTPAPAGQWTLTNFDKNNNNQNLPTGVIPGIDVTINTNGDYRLYGTSNKNKVTVKSGVTANIILDNINMQLGDTTTTSGYTGLAAIGMAGANVNLFLNGTNKIICYGTDSCAVYVPNVSDGSSMINGVSATTPISSVTIQGSGSLLVASGADGAGIGGNCPFSAFIASAGRITINSGTIHAAGGTNGGATHVGAGIGAGGYSSGGFGGIITINGGNVTAVGGINAAGLGGNSGSGGDSGTHGGNITIYGGTIYAYGGSTWPSGPWPSGAVNTPGGWTQTHPGAGIGGGGRGRTGNIHIFGGTLTVRGGKDSAGIGSGSGSGADGGYVNIHGGSGTIYGGSGAAGIGAGKDASPGIVTVFGGSYSEAPPPTPDTILGSISAYAGEPAMLNVNMYLAPPPPPTYLLYVMSGGLGAAGSGWYESGTPVTINAGTPPEGWQFVKWELIEGAVLIEYPQLPIQSINMPSHKVVVEAIFEPLPPKCWPLYGPLDGPKQTITIEGNEPGAL